MGAWVASPARIEGRYLYPIARSRYFRVGNSTTAITANIAWLHFAVRPGTEARSFGALRLSLDNPLNEPSANEQRAAVMLGRVLFASARLPR